MTAAFESGSVQLNDANAPPPSIKKCLLHEHVFEHRTPTGVLNTLPASNVAGMTPGSTPTRIPVATIICRVLGDKESIHRYVRHGFRGYSGVATCGLTTPRTADKGGDFPVELLAHLRDTTRPLTRVLYTVCALGAISATRPLTKVLYAVCALGAISAACVPTPVEIPLCTIVALESGATWHPHDWVEVRPSS